MNNYEICLPLLFILLKAGKRQLTLLVMYKIVILAITKIFQHEKLRLSTYTTTVITMAVIIIHASNPPIKSPISDEPTSSSSSSSSCEATTKGFIKRNVVVDITCHLTLLIIHSVTEVVTGL